MSSFLCSTDTIGLAASALNLHDPYKQGFDDTDEAENELAVLNIDGYRNRYGQFEVTADVTAFRDAMEARLNGSRLLTANTDPLKAYKALRCVLYQSYEGDTPELAVYKKWEDISTKLAHRIAWDACEAANVDAWG